MLAGTESSALYRSTDGGDSWTRVGGLTDAPSSEEWSFPPRPDTHHVRWVEVDPKTPTGCTSASRPAPSSTRRTGATPNTGTSAAVAPGRPHARGPSRRARRVYAAAGDGDSEALRASGSRAAPPGDAESTGGGESWTHPEAGLEHRYVWGLAVDPDDPDRVLVSAARGAGDAHLYRLDGDRESAVRERLDDCGVPTGEGTLRRVLVAPAPGEVYACNDHGLYRSVDDVRENAALSSRPESPSDSGDGDSFDALAAFGDDLAGRTCRGLAVAA